MERSREVVRAAVLEELAEVGYGALTIEGVARRAGVGKATIYRHWRGRVELIAEAFEHAHAEMVPILEAGSAREQLVRLVAHVAEIATDPLFSRCIPALIEGAERDERLAAFHHSYSTTRRGELAAVIAEGVRTGEFEASFEPERAAVALLGMIFYRRLMTSTPFAPSEAEDAVRLVVPAMAEARPATRSSARSRDPA